MNLIDRLLGRDINAVQDAERLYMAILSQSRLPEFYGAKKSPDSYDGRVEILSLHMAMVLRALRTHGEQGERLAQALFDAMVDDFDIALREEGLTDKGVARRIKPIVELVYARIKHYDEVVDGDDDLDLIKSAALEQASTNFATKLHNYIKEMQENFKEKSLQDLAFAKIAFPKFS